MIDKIFNLHFVQIHTYICISHTYITHAAKKKVQNISQIKSKYLSQVFLKAKAKISPLSLSLSLSLTSWLINNIILNIIIIIVFNKCVTLLCHLYNKQPSQPLSVDCTNKLEFYLATN